MNEPHVFNNLLNDLMCSYNELHVRLNYIFTENKNGIDVKEGVKCHLDDLKKNMINANNMIWDINCVLDNIHSDFGKIDFDDNLEFNQCVNNDNSDSEDNENDYNYNNDNDFHISESSEDIHKNIQKHDHEINNIIINDGQQSNNVNL